VAVRRSHKHVTFLVQIGGTFILKIRRDGTLLRKKMFISILRVGR